MDAEMAAETDADAGMAVGTATDTGMDVDVGFTLSPNSTEMDIEILQPGQAWLQSFFVSTSVTISSRELLLFYSFFKFLKY